MSRPAPPGELGNQDYERFRDLILARTGMLFGSRRRDALVRGVVEAVGRAGCESLGEYYYLLQRAQVDGQLWEDLIGVITVGETYFFRNPAHFDALRQHILPDLLVRHRDDRRLRIWSAGCATGEEPYSVAMLLRQLLPAIDRWNISILATDINKQALRRAGTRRYSEGSLRSTDPVIRERYFTLRGGPFDEAGPQPFELCPQVGEMVTFSYLNLVEDSYPSLVTNTNAMDLILCRNVAIYLPEAVIQEIGERFHRCLVWGGWLIVGAAEANAANFNQFAGCNFPSAIIFQKTRRLGETETRRGEDAGIRRLGDTETGGRGEVTPSPRRRVTPSPRPSVTPPLRPLVIPSPRYPAPEAQADLWQEGLALLEQGRLEEAKARFLAHLERDPDSALARYQMARVHANRGKLEEARSWCQQAVGRDPLLTEAYYTLALIHQEEGEPELAIAQLKKTLYLDPSFVLAHFSLANLYQQLDRPGEARRHRERAIRLAAQMLPDQVLAGSDGLTTKRLLTMARATT